MPRWARRCDLIRSLVTVGVDTHTDVHCLKRYIAREIYPRLLSPPRLVGRQR